VLKLDPALGAVIEVNDNEGWPEGQLVAKEREYTLTFPDLEIEQLRVPQDSFTIDRFTGEGWVHSQSPTRINRIRCEAMKGPTI
jgi:hypothetical protein